MQSQLKNSKSEREENDIEIWSDQSNFPKPINAPINPVNQAKLSTLQNVNNDIQFNALNGAAKDAEGTSATNVQRVTQQIGSGKVNPGVNSTPNRCPVAIIVTASAMQRSQPIAPQ